MAIVSISNVMETKTRSEHGDRAIEVLFHRHQMLTLNDMQGRRCILYRRVSHASQCEDGISLEAQQVKLAAYATAYDMAVVMEVEDAGISAKSLDRPGLQRALSLLKEG